MRAKRQPVIMGSIAFLPLTRGMYAIIDAADVPLVAGYNWRAKKPRGTRYTWYAVRSTYSQPSTAYLHRAINGEGTIDHRNRNGLDNRRVNLRPCSESQNRANGSLRLDNTSGIRGVFWDGEKRRWMARVDMNKRRWQRRFHSLNEAIQARDAKALEMQGEFAILNRPSSSASAPSTTKASDTR